MTRPYRILGPWKTCILAAMVLYQPVAVSAITPNSQETQMANLITTNAGQQRASMTYNAVLHLVARAKVRDMATRPFSGHTDPDGYGPNFVAGLAEYALPGYYGSAKDSNNIESLAAGNSTALATFNDWMGSPPHKTHILAEDEFWQAQTYYGIGYYYKAGSPYGHYWAFVSAPPDPSAVLSPYIEWLFDNLVPVEIDDPESDPDSDGIRTLMEYALGFDPATATTNACFTFAYDRGLERGAITAPIRPDLDPQIQVLIETTTNLITQAWHTNDVQKVGNTFSAGGPPDHSRFFRLKVCRDTCLAVPGTVPEDPPTSAVLNPSVLFLLF